MKALAALILLTGFTAFAQMPPRVVDDLLWQATKPAPAAGGYLNDRWYFAVVTTSNNAPFQIGFIGTGTRRIYWGDGGETVTNGDVTVSYTYATAGSNVLSVAEVSGSTTRLAFYNLTGNSQLKRWLSVGSVALTNINSLSQSFRSCSGLSGSIPDISGLTKLTAMDSAFRSCSGLSGSIPDISGLTNLTTLAYAFWNCSGLTGNIPDISGLTNLTTLDSAFRSCSGLSGSIPNIGGLTKLTTMAYAFLDCSGLTANTNTVAGIFGALSRTNLTTANQCFSVSSGAGAYLVGNAGDFIALEKSPSFVTNTLSSGGSYRMFYNQTNLADYATIPDDWK